MSAEIEEYDRDTIAYLRGVGVEPPMLGRVERLAQEVAELKASAPLNRAALAAAAHKRFCLDPSARTHMPDEHDYDKADEILEILALVKS